MRIHGPSSVSVLDGSRDGAIFPDSTCKVSCPARLFIFPDKCYHAGHLYQSAACLHDVWPSAPIPPPLGGRASVVGISVGLRRALEVLVRMIDQHGIKPLIDASHSFWQVREAFAHLKRGAFGKVVMEVGT